ncbi:MAG: sugar ABC transporter ATP-binding protein [Phycisphaerae bacterium]|nr:MAG: sugar ABC transporter ATP-binding protein [Phycisphaerae bacterium]
MAGAVQFSKVGKKFRRGAVHESLRDLLASTGRRIVGRKVHSKRPTFWAVRNLGFEISPGEALGIIGPNGAGKSTALKLLAGILRPDEGSIHVNGRLAALIEVNAGMHGDLTGMENIFLTGAIMGMNRAEIKSKLDDIIEFSGIGDFIHTPVKRYSTGMQARLGFSTAAHVSPDVLLVDEVLSVGDVAFRHRCEERMREMVESGVALIFVTHNLEQMRSICHRTLVLDGGECAFVGSPADAVGHYLKATMTRVGEMSYVDNPRKGDTDGRVSGMTFRGADGSEVECVRPSEPLTMEIGFELDRDVDRLTVETAIRRDGGEMMVSLNSRHQGITFKAPAGRHDVRIELPAFPLGGGNYFAIVRLWDADRSELLAETPYKFMLQVDDQGKGTGLLSLPHEWSALKTIEPMLANQKQAVDAAHCEPCTKS